MAATTVNGDNVTNLEASPAVTLETAGKQKKVLIDTVAAATTSLDETNDAIMLGPLPSNAIITSLAIKNDDLDSNCTPALAVNIGAYYSGVGGNQSNDGNTSGTVIDADLFASAVTTLQSANANWVELLGESTVYGVEDATTELWSAAGLSSDPGGLIYVGIAVTTAAGTAAAGDIALKVEYIAK
jgi:hypothetical protein